VGLGQLLHIHPARPLGLREPSVNGPDSRARHRIALRLLPLLYLMYVVCFIDRVNVSFANLRMSVDLGLSDTAYGLGVGFFALGYILFEIPGAVIVERWSARKWFARIMITWGLFTILTAFVRTVPQFYAVRFLVGLAEASFFPGVIVYLTHWFIAADRAKAIAGFFTGLPTAAIAGSLLAGWLLGIHWLGLAGWRWLFIVEGVPPIALGVIGLRYLTDRPEEARWLPADERQWLVQQLASEAAVKEQKDSVIKAFADRRVLLLTVGWFCALCGAQGSLFFLPSFLKRLSGLPDPAVAFLVALPGVAAMIGMLVNAWHTDRTGERRWHAVLPLCCAGIAYILLASGTHSLAVNIVLLTAGVAFLYSSYPPLWAMPTLILRGTTAAAGLGLINSIGQLGGLVGPYTVGSLNDRTGGLTAAFCFIAACYVATAVLVAGAGAATASRFRVRPTVAALKPTH
jgi:ACS family tartrate transporter-like MFS transporter